MTLHPLISALAIIDSIILVLFLQTLYFALAVKVKWASNSPTREQLNLERQAEQMSLLVRIIFLLNCCSVFFMLLVISLFLPDSIPGAMCGTGVLQAMGHYGNRALLFLFATLILLIWLNGLNVLSSKDAQGHLFPVIAQSVLFISPFQFLGLFDTFRAFYSLNAQEPVNCCSVLYDSLESIDVHVSVLSSNKGMFIGLYFLLTGLLVFIAFLSAYLQKGTFLRLLVVQFGLTWCWLLLAYLMLISVFSSYIYEVMNHHCPWCFFLPEHNGIGFLYFLLLLFITIRGTELPILFFLTRRQPDFSEKLKERLPGNAWTLLVLIVVYNALVSLPALRWYFRSGVWLF